MRSALISICLLIFSTCSFADTPAPTKDDAKAFVKDAVKYLKENGQEKFFNEVRSPSGKFHFKQGENKGLYIFVYDEKGTVLAHGVRLELTGKNRWDDKDPDGKYWIRDWTDLVHKSGSGWIEYKEFNPADKNKTMNKASFVELVNGNVIGCGIYF
jgi:signal transduction histidine kinase